MNGQDIDTVYDRIRDQKMEDSYYRSIKDTEDVLKEHGWKIKAIPDSNDENKEIIIFKKNNEEIVLERTLPAKDSIERSFIELDKSLKNFDYTYDYSDDHRVYREGRAEQNRISQEIEKLKQIDEKRVLELIFKHKHNHGVQFQ